MRRIVLTLGLLLALDCSVADAQLRTQTIASGLGIFGVEPVEEMR